MTTKKCVGGHGKKNILIATLAYEKHATGRIEAEHGMFAFKGAVRLFEVHLEGEPLIGGCIGKDGSKANRIGDGKVVVYHGLVGVHENLTSAKGDTKLIVDDELAPAGEKVNGVLVTGFIEGLEGGELEGFHG